MKPPGVRIIDIRATDSAAEGADDSRELSQTSQFQAPRSLRPDSGLLARYAAEVKQRLIMRSQERLTRQSLSGLIAETERITLLAGYQVALDGYRRLPVEQKLKMEEMELRREELDGQRELNRRLGPLRIEVEELALQVQIEKHKKERELLMSPSAPVPNSPSPEQQRAKDKSDCDKRIQALKVEKQHALKLEDEQERILKVNAIDDVLHREMERWAKLL